MTMISPMLPVIQQIQVKPACQPITKTLTFREFWPLHTQHPTILSALLHTFTLTGPRPSRSLSLGIQYQITNAPAFYKQVSAFLQEDYPRLSRSDIALLSRFLTAYHQELLVSAV